MPFQSLSLVPTQATAETGKVIMEAILEQEVAFAKEYWTVSESVSEN